MGTTALMGSWLARFCAQFHWSEVTDQSLPSGVPGRTRPSGGQGVEGRSHGWCLPPIICFLPAPFPTTHLPKPQTAS